MFAGLGIFFSFAALFNAATKFSIAELWIIWLGTLVLVRYGLHYVFHRTSVHRGIWHSLIAGVFSSVATALVFFYVLKKPEGVAWLAAGFMMIGYITHLVLDEMYSVDVMDTRIKASFGTALKIFDRRYPSASLAMTAAAAAAIYVAPPTKMFVDGVRTEGLWSGLHQRMLPKDKWFGVIATHRSSASQGAGGEQGAVTTGSITPAKITQPTSTEAPAAVPQAPLAPAPTPQQ